MNRSISSVSKLAFGIRCLAFLSPALLAHTVFAQTSILVFGPVNQRASATGTGYGTAAVNFNSSTLNLTCSQTPITATLSSTADSTGNVLVDNNINVSVTAGGTTTGPTNVCVGGVNGSAIGIPFQNCFNGYYEFPPAGVSFLGEDPDTFASAGGIPPFSIASQLVPGNQMLTIAEQDEGFVLASTTLYLNTNCTQNGVTGPALITGNPIPAGNPTPDQLSQDFSFNPLTGQQVGFQYDLTAAEAAGSLTIQDGTIPNVADAPLDPAIFQSQYAPGTSFATSSCILHNGEVLANGSPACKLYTLQCTVGTGATATGAQCPASAEANEIFQDVFDGPAFTLADIPTPGGPTFHEGIGLIMANDSWTGGPCTFDPAADLGNQNCPQNLLTSFTSSTVASEAVRSSSVKAPVSEIARVGREALVQRPRAALSGAGSGTNTSTGSTTRPNSTFLTIAQIPEDLTTVTVAGQNANGWIKQSTANVSFSSQPPNLSGTTLPGAASFVPSPIQSITYGISPAASVPPAGSPVAGDVTLTNSIACPTPPNLSTPPATTFTPAEQTFTSLADGNYLVHYFAQDCAGTEELKFTQDVNGNWSTNFYTYPVNVDTTPPVVTTPTLASQSLSPEPSAAGTYFVGTPLTASFSCSDALSGVVQCGTHTYAPGTGSTGTLTSPVPTSSTGLQSYSVTALDAAGNQTVSTPVSYTIIPYDSQIQFTVTPQSSTFPVGPLASVTVLPGPTPLVKGSSPTGTVQIFDGTTVIDTLTLRNGTVSQPLLGLAAGKHVLTAVYSGSATIPGGTSAPVTVTVNPGPTQISALCSSSTIALGSKYSCAVYVDTIDLLPASGSLTYQFDSAPPVSVPLNFGIAIVTIPAPGLGKHSLVLSYAAQGSYLAAAPKTETFTVVAPAVK